MPEVRVSISLPFALLLAEGDYPTTAAGEIIRISAGPPEETEPQTVVSATFDHPDGENPDAIQSLQFQDADRLLRRTNRLLRWYRSVCHLGDITEMTRARASPFRFEAKDGADAAWTQPLEYEETGPAAAAISIPEITNAVRVGLASGADPPVDVLFILDAERAIQQGRFREAVLFCWSTIDSVFNRKYDALAKAALAGEWADALAEFTGHEFGLRLKMSAGMHLLANRSLFREPDGLWEAMSTSYAKRNNIIHRGQNATEDEARQALDVARRIVAIMNGLQVPAAPGGA